MILYFFLFVIAWPFCHILGGNMQIFAVSARIQWLNPCAIDYFQKLIISHKYVTFELLLNIQRYIRWWKQYRCYFWGLISGGNIKKSQVSARNIFDSICHRDWSMTPRLLFSENCNTVSCNTCDWCHCASRIFKNPSQLTILLI